MEKEAGVEQPAPLQDELARGSLNDFVERRHATFQQEIQVDIISKGGPSAQSVCFHQRHFLGRGEPQVAKAFVELLARHQVVNQRKRVSEKSDPNAVDGPGGLIEFPTNGLDVGGSKQTLKFPSDALRRNPFVR